MGCPTPYNWAISFPEWWVLGERKKGKLKTGLEFKGRLAGGWKGEKKAGKREDYKGFWEGKEEKKERENEMYP